MFPALYHSHHIRNPEDQNFWLDLAKRYGARILELGCGTGRVLLPLTEAGYPTYGLDRDAQMLSFLKEITPVGLRSQVNTFQGDLCAYHLAAQFSLILLPCNTYSTLSPSQRAQALQRVRQHLQPSGIFAASMPNPVLLESLPLQSDPEIEEVFPHPQDGEPVQVSSAWKRTRQQAAFTWYYDHLLPDGKVHRTTQQVIHYITPIETIKSELNAAGLEITDLYGNFDKSPYTIQASYLILLARPGIPIHF
jgi:SAM-dependent methyltransferase